MNSLIQRVATFALTLIFATIPFIATPLAHAGTLGGGTSYSGWGGWTFSYSNLQLTRANITLEDGTIIAAPTFDITETSFSAPDAEGIITGTGSALFTGIMKETHGPVPGEAWVKVQMVWPELDIKIIPENIDAQLPNGDTFTLIKETRTYKVMLDGDSTTPALNTDKLSGFRQVQYDLPLSGVYAICDSLESTDGLPNVNNGATTYDSYLCYQKIGYGDTPIDPTKIFFDTITASGQEVKANVGFYWDEVCLAAEPDELNVSLNGEIFYLKEDADGKFRACEGRSVVARTCTDPDNSDDSFDCMDNESQPDGQYFTLSVLDAAAGDRIEPAPATTCIGTETEDWLKLATYSDSGEKLIITPCDPSQGYIPLTGIFTDKEIGFSNSGDELVIGGLNIVGITSGPLQETAIFLGDNPDQYNNEFDFSNMILDVLYVRGNELDDTMIMSIGDDVALGDNGNDTIYGFSGNDCLDGGQNDDNLWGDGHPDAAHDQGTRGADVFVLNSKLGKDIIHDFVVGQDMLMNTSGTTPTITDNSDDTYTVALKGQNNVIVKVTGALILDPSTDELIYTEDLTDVVFDSSSISDGLTGVCAGHPLAN